MAHGDLDDVLRRQFVDVCGVVQQSLSRAGAWRCKSWMSVLIWYGRCLYGTRSLYGAYGVISLYGVLSLCAEVCGAGAEVGGISERAYSQGKT